MQTLKINVPDMQSSHCQLRVNNALQNTHGVKVEEISAGIIKVNLESAEDQALVVANIQQAGYSVATIEVLNQPNNSHHLLFKTNIKCGGCVAKVAPILNSAQGVEQWNVDIHHPDKLLTVSLNGVDATTVISLVQQAGFQATVLAK